MSNWKSFGLAVFAVVCLLGETTGSAHAQRIICATEWSGSRVINLGSLSDSLFSEAYGINGTGQAVGDADFGAGEYATEWSGNRVILNMGDDAGRLCRLGLGWLSSEQKQARNLA
jgi:hypothetical protein